MDLANLLSLLTVTDQCCQEPCLMWVVALFGVHQLVKNSLTACYNLNPPKPKYSSTWDPDVVLRLLSSLGENSALPLTVLSQKVAILLAVKRVSELASIDASSFCV